MSSHRRSLFTGEKYINKKKSFFNLPGVNLGINTMIFLHSYLPYNLKVIFGLYDGCYADITSTTYSVSSIIIHPEFQYATRLNDLALLRLNSAVPFQQRIAPICLPTPGMCRLCSGFLSWLRFWYGISGVKSNLYDLEANYDHKVATIAAWLEGLTADNQSTSTCQPRKLDLPVIPRDACTVPLEDSQSCVGVRGSASALCRVCKFILFWYILSHWHFSNGNSHLNI